MATTVLPTPAYTYKEALVEVKNDIRTPEEAAEKLLDQLTVKETLSLFDGDLPIRQMTKIPAMLKAGGVTAGAVQRLGIPGVKFVDGPRGVMAGNSTAFPVTMSRGATWDPALENEIGLAMGREGRAYGANYSGAVCINLLRHPSWGRAQECYGEDPVLSGTMGVALSNGLRRNVMACVKHFALNSMENSRFKVDVTVDEHALHEVYLPHFKKLVDSGAESIMSSYNSVNGAFAGENKVLLTDILRDEWGFTGFVTSDWLWGFQDPIKAFAAGQDIEMPFTAMMGRELPKAVKEKRISRKAIRRSARRIVATTLRHEAQVDPAVPERSVIASAEHRALARRAASRGMVLLKNEPVAGTPLLPLDRSTLKHVVVIGELATQPNMGDRGSSNVAAPTTSSPLDGIREGLPGVRVDHLDGSDADAAARAAAAADVAIVVVGMRPDDEGEYLINDNIEGLAVFGFPFTVPWLRNALGRFSPMNRKSGDNDAFGSGGDRAILTLRADEEKLVKTVAAANPRTVPVLIGGSAIITESWKSDVSAILMSWYPGMEGGRAISDVLIGASEPSGRLPFTIPTDAAHLPHFVVDTDDIVYDEWWGQRKLDRDGHSAAFPFGFGLGYSTFTTELLEAESAHDTGTALVRVQNTSDRAGSTVAQVYTYDEAASPRIPQLVGFARVDLDASESVDVMVDLDLTPTLERDPASRRWSRRPGVWQVVVAQASPAAPADGITLFPHQAKA